MLRSLNLIYYQVREEMNIAFNVILSYYNWGYLIVKKIQDLT